MRLFRSHNPDYKDGEQMRDFVYVKDVVKVIYWMIEETINVNRKSIVNTLTNNDSRLTSGLYNLGTGTARSFDDLVKSTFAGLDLESNIQYIDMPLDIRDKYQYFTEANMQKLKDAGYTEEFYSLEEGVNDYVRHYLKELKIY